VYGLKQQQHNKTLIVLRGGRPSPWFGNNYMNRTKDKIEIAVAKAKALERSSIEYNLDELPKMKGISETSFHGVKAVFTPNAPKNSVNVIYKYG